MIDKKQLKLYAITDRAWLGDKSLASQVRLAIEGGATIVQFREKKLNRDELVELALEVKSVCNEYNVPFIINDDVNLAKEIDADGVHVGQSDASVAEARRILGEGKIVGATAKTLEQARVAYEQGADYLGSGAVFGSATKTDAIPMSKELLTSICESVPIPVVAIGGIDESNVSMLAGAPIAGVAVVSGIFAMTDILAATKKLVQMVEDII